MKRFIALFLAFISLVVLTACPADDAQSSSVNESNTSSQQEETLPESITAANKLIEQNKVLQARVMDEVFNKMESGNAALAPYYAGDFYTMKDANDDLEFVYPKEGTNIFVDSVCVPQTAQNYDAAMMYINFLLEPEVALANAEYICYASPNTSVINNEEYSFKDDPILYPPEEIKSNTQYYHDLDPEIRDYYESLWTKVRIS